MENPPRECQAACAGSLCARSAGRAVVATQGENYYKTRGWIKKKEQNFPGQTQRGEGQLFIGPDITLHVTKWCRAKPDEFGAEWGNKAAVHAGI